MEKVGHITALVPYHGLARTEVFRPAPTVSLLEMSAPGHETDMTRCLIRVRYEDWSEYGNIAAPDTNSNPACRHLGIDDGLDDPVPACGLLVECSRCLVERKPMRSERRQLDATTLYERNRARINLRHPARELDRKALAP